MGGGRGSSSTLNKGSMSVSDFSLEKNKWKPREIENLNRALGWMSDNFGDIRNLIGSLYKRSFQGYDGLYDRDGDRGKGRATYFNSHVVITSEKTMAHEFTHAVTEEIASKYLALGYETRDDVLKAMRSEVYRRNGHEEPKWDGRKWASRPEEFFSRNAENMDSNSTAVQVIKEWFERSKKLSSKRPKPETVHITLW